MPLHPFAVRPSLQMPDSQLHQRADGGTGQTEQYKDIVRQGEAGAEPHQQRVDKQRNSRNAQCQHPYGQPAPARDFREVAGEEFD